VSLERLWADWRSDYVSHPDTGRDDKGCVMCRLVASTDDVEALVLERTPATIVVMNLYPYGSGHLMVAPTRQYRELRRPHRQTRASPSRADAPAASGARPRIARRRQRRESGTSAGARARALPGHLRDAPCFPAGTAT
jgi:hypothetical protein